MSKFFINRPIVAMVISIVMVLVGGLTMLTLPVAQFPNITPPEIQILATYVGADAQTLEQAVATPIEQQMNGVDNMNYMYSVNATANSTTTLITDFDVKTDPNTDYILAQSRETQAASQLPTDVTNYGITVRKSVTAPLMWVALYSPHGTYDARFLANYAYINLVDPILRSTRRRQRERLRLRPIRDALMGKTRHLGQAGHHRPRDRQRHSSAKHREPDREGRRRACSQRPGIHLFGARPGPSRLAGRIRSDRRARDSRRRDRPRTRCRAHRAGFAGLYRRWTFQWRAQRYPLHLPIARLQRRRCRRRHQEIDVANETTLSRRTWISRLRSIPLFR